MLPIVSGTETLPLVEFPSLEVADMALETSYEPL